MKLTSDTMLRVHRAPRDASAEAALYCIAPLGNIHLVVREAMYDAGLRRLVRELESGLPASLHFMGEWCYGFSLASCGSSIEGPLTRQMLEQRGE